MTSTVGEKCSPEVIVEDIDPRCFREKVLVGLDCSAVWRKKENLFKSKQRLMTFTEFKKSIANIIGLYTNDLRAWSKEYGAGALKECLNPLLPF